jgi:hypothetical protein
MSSLEPGLAAGDARPTGRRRGRVRRAWLALASGLLLFAGMQVVLDVLSGPLRLRAGDFAVRYDYLRRRMGEPGARPWTVVLLGSSRVQYGLRGGLLEGHLAAATGRPVVVVNFGAGGAGPCHSLLTWQRLLRRGVRPDLLVLEVLPALLNEPAAYDEFAERLLPPQALLWEDLPLVQRYSADGRPSLRRDWLAGALAPLHTYRRTLLSRSAGALLPSRQRVAADPRLDDPQGTELPVAEMCRQRAQHLRRTRADYTAMLADFRVGERADRAVRELLESCREQGVPAALLVMPEGEVFRSWYPPGSWALLERYLRALCRDYGTALINARRWSPEREFFDSHHLLPGAAERVTARLGREGVVPLLRRGRPAQRGGAALGANSGERHTPSRLSQ